LNPRVSFGVPVYNGTDTIRKCLDSILAQDHDDFEVVVCDNCSTDDTRKILAEYAAKDPRVQVHLNEENIGQIENCNLVFKLSRGEYFRWLGVSDWIEPDYLSECLAAFDADPEAIAMTTSFVFHLSDGTTVSEDHDGERVEADEPDKRFAKMLWFYHAGQTKYDPLYSLIRRDALARTPMLRMQLKADWILAAELALLGRFAHVPKRLAHRHKPAKFSQRWESSRRAYHPRLYKQLSGTPWQLYRLLVSVAKRAKLGFSGRLRCRRAALRFLYKESSIEYGAEIARFRRQKLGLTRDNLFFWRRRKTGPSDAHHG
jgi:glycosyltransferase involved in cell wall biosynthesis